MMMTFHLKAHNQSRYSKLWLTPYMVWETQLICVITKFLFWDIKESVLTGIHRCDKVGLNLSIDAYELPS